MLPRLSKAGVGGWSNPNWNNHPLPPPWKGGGVVSMDGFYCEFYLPPPRSPNSLSQPSTIMALRFRRRIKILPGVHLNISRSGISTSIGVRGASVTLGKNGRYLNTGLPGTGISMRTRLDSPTANRPMASSAPELTSAPEIATTQSVQPIHTQYLHWWKVLLFIATMIAAGATKSNVVIGVFWFGWFGYWLVLFVRLVYRNANTKSALN